MPLLLTVAVLLAFAFCTPLPATMVSVAPAPLLAVGIEVAVAARLLLHVRCSAVTCHHDVIVCISALSGIALPWILYTAYKHILLCVDVGGVSCTDTVVRASVREIAVNNVYLSVAYAWVALMTTFVKPAVSECSAQFTFVACLAVAATPEACVTMVVRTA